MKLRDQQVAVTVTGTGNKVLLLNFGKGGGELHCATDLFIFVV